LFLLLKAVAKAVNADGAEMGAWGRGGKTEGKERRFGGAAGVTGTDALYRQIAATSLPQRGPDPDDLNEGLVFGIFVSKSFSLFGG
jgi:hypothetical protein